MHNAFQVFGTNGRFSGLGMKEKEMDLGRRW